MKNIIKLLLFTVLCESLLVACNKSLDEVEKISPTKIELSMVSNIANTGVENSLEKISVYCFALKPGASDFTFEKKISNLAPADNNGKATISWSLDGSLERQFYFVANENEKVATNNLTPQTTTSQFEKNIYMIDAKQPQLPFVLVAKTLPMSPDAQTQINAQFTHTLSCLDIVNLYQDFTIDSLILRNTSSGAYLFDNDLLNTEIAPKIDLNYFTDTNIFLYPTQNSTLAVYGKYNGIRVAFDIKLNDIKRATKYRVTIKSANEQTINFSSSLSLGVVFWNLGQDIDSVPNWNKN